MVLNLKEENQKTTELLSQELLKYTPLLYENHSIEPIPISSSLLIQLNNTNYLVTAAHVLKNKKKIAIFLENRFLILDGTPVYTNTDSDNDNNKVDLAIWKLTRENADSMSLKYNFFLLDKYCFDFEVKKDHQYIVFGYPLTQIKFIREEKKYKIKPFFHQTNVSSNSKYNKLNFDQRSHIVLEYNKKEVENFEKNIIYRGPNLNGISGCGIWPSPELNLTEGQKTPFFPIGIVIEYHSNSDAIVATRINVLTELIRNKFDSSLQKSQIIKIL